MSVSAASSATSQLMTDAAAETQITTALWACVAWWERLTQWNQWHKASASHSSLVSINEVNLVQARLVLGWVTCPGSVPGARHISRYVTSQPGQLSLAIPPWVGTMSTSQGAMTPCCWGVKAGMVHVWVTSKTVWSRYYTRAISERFRDKELIIKRCINSSVYFTSILWY